MPAPLDAAWTRRIESVQTARHAAGLDALVVSDPTNIRYLTGFDGSAGLLLLSIGDVRLLVDGRYQAVVRDGVARGELAAVRLEPVPLRYDRTLGDVINAARWARVGFESAHLTVATLTAWQRRTPAAAWVATDEVVERARAIKDDVEIAILRRGGRAIAGVAERLPQLIAEGLTEREVAARIDAAVVEAGFSGPSFPTIVASGPNGAHPHARPSDRKLVRGDLVVLDFGGVLDGYCLDLTRMSGIGQVSADAHAMFDAVFDAQAAAIAAVRPGVPGHVVDAAARTILESRGLAEAFLHATGHGLGLQVHEGPRIARIDPDATQPPPVLEAGMVITVEPGAYVDGLGGVRLEDDVLVTTSGCEVLTEAPRRLLIV
jgi:Xaa-Pro aminopeptidase